MKKLLLSTVFFLVLIAGFGLVQPVWAQVLTLSPDTATKTVGEQFTVELNIDTAGKAVAGADVKMTYDADILELVNVTVLKSANGGFFTEGASNLSAGNIYLAGFFSEQFKTESGTGKVATLTLKGKKLGTGQLVFACTSQTNDTNILDGTAADIANCAAFKNGTYTFTEGASAPVPTATSTPGPTGAAATAAPTATPAVPVSGAILPSIFTLGIGSVLTILGLALII